MHKRCFLFLSFLMTLAINAIGQAYVNNINAKVESLLSRMTLEEKIGQLNQYPGQLMTGPANEKKADMETDIQKGWVGSVLNVKGARNTRAIQELAMRSRLKIPLLFGYDVIHGYQTTLPIPLAEASSWDIATIELSARIAAREAAAAGIHWTFAPMVDIARDPRWGRMMEGAGEDPYLGSLIAAARVKGFQGKSLGDTDAVMATAKHFAAYGAPTAGRDYTAVEMSEHELWQTYLPPFKAAADAGVATFMNSFNTLNGVPATGNKYLLRNILKGQWQYRGFVVSDWNSVGEMIIWGYATEQKDAAFKAITAGTDMDMQSGIYRRTLVGLVNDGKVNISTIDDAVKRILYKKYELGLFDDPFKFSNEDWEKKVLNDPTSRIKARAIAQRSIVMLKNDEHVLPIGPKIPTIALIGPLGKSRRDHAGAWNVNEDTTSIVNLFEGISNSLGKGQKLIYARGGSVHQSTDADIAEAVAIASKANVVVMALGEGHDMSGESKSRANIELPGDQEKLFLAVQKTGKPVVVIVMGGRPMIFNAIADNAQTILYAWWLGSEAGNAIADLLFGKYNPSGKLPVSFPRSMGQVPIYYSHTNTGRPYDNVSKKIYRSAYIDENNSPRYAFGHGLSYTTFKYDELKIDKEILSGNDNIRITFNITNTGNIKGEEVAQLYLHDEVASVVQPVKLLKDFTKISLQPGETRKVTFVIGSEKLSFYRQDLTFGTEPGTFRFMIGSASDDIRLDGQFSLR